MKNFIGGEWVDGCDTLTTRNPSDLSDIIGEVAIATPAQVEEAIAVAREAQAGWAAATIQQRSDTLLAIATEIQARASELGKLLAREEGKTIPEGTGEVMRAAQVFRFFSGECLRVGGERLPSVRPGVDVTMSRSPVGVVGVITPWNFPIAIPAWKIAPALAFGNAVVFKPSEFVSAMAVALTEIIDNAGVPKGVLNLVMGPGAAIGETLLNGVDAVTFTGSVATGRKVTAAATACMIRCQCEMGGKNPFIVMDDADLDTAVACALDGSFFQTGQRCTASSRLIVHKDIHDPFVVALTERMSALRVGSALDPNTQIGPVNNAAQLEKNLSYLEVGASEGAEFAIKGEALKRDTEGYFMSPSLFVGTANDMRINREEIFGPVASTIIVDGFEEAMAIANDTDYGLSAGIATTSHAYARAFEEQSESGLTMINLPTAGLDYHVPFGGRKASNYGPREQGSMAVEFYTIVKTSYRA